MNQSQIFLPLLLQVALTFVVWLWMYGVRLREIAVKNIDAQALATREQASKRLKNTAPADNFSNQFELPVLFYVLVFSIYLTQSLTPLLLGMAYLFVALRVLHSLIHCSINHVMTRFGVYQAASWVLWAMWSVFAFRLLDAA